MTKTGRHFILAAILSTAPGVACAVESAPVAKPMQPPITANAPPPAADRPMVLNQVIVDDVRHPALLPEWHPQGMGDRISLAMSSISLPGAQFTLNVRF